MTTASAESTGYKAFVDNMNGVLERNFGTSVPSTTKRSGGLDPQCGLVIGLRPSAHAMDEIVHNLKGLPGIWSKYDHTSLHLTLGACEDRTTSDVTTPLADDRSMEQRFAQLLGAMQRAAGANVSLTDTRVLVSGDTIVLTGTPSPDLFQVREQLTGDQAAQQSGIKPGWGAHLTLARAKGILTDGERLTTNEWLATQGMPSVLDLRQVLAAAFSVGDNTFQVVRRSVCELPAR